MQDAAPTSKPHQSREPEPRARGRKVRVLRDPLDRRLPGRLLLLRKYYDYSNATMVFLTPGEIFRMSENNTLPNKGYLLAFHPDLLFHTSLDNPIKNYTFFAYHKEEALHLSQRETAKVTCCLENIEDELHHAIDTHSGTILSRHIELLLDYCTRYYERQFITRENKNKAILEKLERLLDEYIISGKLENGQLPTAEYCTAGPFCRLLQRPVKIRDRQNTGGIFSVQTIERG